MAAGHTPDPIPVVDALSDIYTSKSTVASQGQRWDKLTAKFRQEFSEKPTFIARAPGRVNIIGEHVDHMGFGVFPAAIELDILMAVRVVPADASSTTQGEPSIDFDLRNTTQRFEPTQFSSGIQNTDSVQLLHEGGSRWANYFKVAWKGLHPHLPESVLSSKSLPSRIEVVVDGSIPPESSLSSSAAMTVCSSIVILQALGAREHISRSEMAEVAIESERLVGVASGGMDQAASIFGHPSSALHITFHPKLAISRVSLPPSEPQCTFVIANTLVVSDKKVNGPVQYNLRVVELLIAARVFAKKVGLPQDDSTKTWRKLMDVYYQHNPLQSSLSSDSELSKIHSDLGEEAAQIYHMSQLIDTNLPRGLISQEEAQSLSGYSTAEAFHDEFTSQFTVRAPEGFNLHSRTRHVFAESLRVHQFRSLCLSMTPASSSSSSSSTTNVSAEDRYKTYTQLGELMNASHASLKQDYENSCPELESIISLARSAGALGSRLTGAGWGGSTVHLVPVGRVDEVVETLKRQFYAKRWAGQEELVQGAVLESMPAGGACVYQV